jgi:hypothetical protein
MGSELKVALWSSVTPEQFILHVCSVIHTCKRLEHDIKFSSAATALLNLGIKNDEYAQVRSSERKQNKGNPGESVPAASESLVAAKSAHE